MRALMAAFAGMLQKRGSLAADRPLGSSGSFGQGCKAARIAAASCTLSASAAGEQQVPGIAFLAAAQAGACLHQHRRAAVCATPQVQPAAHALAALHPQQPFLAADRAWGLCGCSCRQPTAALIQLPHHHARQPRMPLAAQQQQQQHLLQALTPAGTRGQSCSTPCSCRVAVAAGGAPVRQQRQQQSGSPLQAAGVAAGPATGWDAAAGSSSQQSADYQGKRMVDMTEEEKHLLLRGKLADEWGGDPPALHQGTQRLVCPECGNGSLHEDCFAVTVEEDAILWFCHRATCGYQGAVYVHGGRWTSSREVGAAAGAIAQASRVRGTAQSLFNGGSAVEAPARALWQQQQQVDWKPGVALGSRLQPLTAEMLEWFKGRGISEVTLQRNGVMSEMHYCAPLGRQEQHIAFPYRRGGVIVNIKYRTLDKHFSQTKGGEQIFYGYDDAQGAREIIIVEGELDKLAIEEALLQLQQQQSPPAGAAEGGTAGPAAAAAATAAGEGGGAHPLGGVAVLSVPSGAPASSPSGPGSLERKFRYLLNCSDILTSAERVVLAVDSDGPGLLLADELARRIGREKCWRVTWPTGPHDSLAPGPPAQPATSGGEDAAAAEAAAAGFARKDANEVLMKDGAAVLCAYLDAAQPLPIRGLFRFDEFWPQVYDLYQQGPRGLSWGVSSGWDSVDSCYKVVPGELTIVTGLPNTGKSEWLDALAVNLARQQGWRIALCSMENSVVEHGRKIMEKYSGKAFFDAEYSRGTSKMDFDEFVDTLLWVDEHFHIIRPPPETLPTIDYILNLARAAVLRYGIHGLIIDPYNELDHRRPAMFSETEHVSRLLTKIKRFAQHYDVHVWFVAHPRTQRGLGIGGGTAALPAPTMYDISGSANFINKADNGIVVHRQYAAPAQGQEGTSDPFATQLLVRKVRNKLAGKIGDVKLRYDRATGSYKEYDG